MKYGKHFSLCLLAALGLMAFAASGAQAEWLIAGKKLTGVELIKVTQHTEGLLTVPAMALILHCTELSSVLGDLTVIDGTAANLFATAELLYKNCTTLVNNILAPECKPIEPIVAKVRGDLILHSTLTFILFKPHVGETFATVKFPGGTCGLPETNPVKGTLVAECLNEKLETKEQTKVDECLKEMLKHLIKPASETLFPRPTHGLKFGANPATLSGIASIQLDNSDNIWCGHI